jgi:hypothetical protein
LVEASSKKKNEFLLGALGAAESKVTNAGLSDIVWDNSGLTISKKDDQSQKIRLTSGGILFSKNTPQGTQWRTGITADGVSADLITAGSINTGEIEIKCGNDTTFKWDRYGLSAFDFVDQLDGTTTVNPSKFVRFDKYGIYGISNNLRANESPESSTWINGNATFALTWEGLKVTGNNNVVARIGRQGNDILQIANGSNNLLTFSNSGVLNIGGWKVSA